MRENFGVLPNGEQASLYTISCGKLKAQISDFGATLVRLYVPDANGNLADVVLGFSEAKEYQASTTFFGATVGRNANRIGGASFQLGDRLVQLTPNDKGKHNLHSGPDSYAFRMWKVENYEEDSITLYLQSSDKDQGYPGNAEIRVTYKLEYPATLRLIYDAVSDQDTVFNMTNHSYFNLAGHDKPELAMNQILMMPARFFTPSGPESIPNGEERNVEGTPMDFRTPKPIGRDIGETYDALEYQKGYDHNFEVFTDPCAVLTDPVSGRSMAVSTDCPGIQVYSGNFFKNDPGKDGVIYCFRGGVALETQFFPNCVNIPQWKQPIVKAGEHYHSETKYSFS